MPAKHSIKPVQSTASKQADRWYPARSASVPANLIGRQRLEELAAFKKEHGHCCVSTLDKRHARLGYWVRTQRGRRRRGQLSQEQIRILDELGFSWDVQGGRNRARWESMYEALAAYQRAHGHCRGPFSTSDQFSLARWVERQRHARYKGKLSAERVRRLDELGFLWNVQGVMWQAKWESMYEALAAYRQAHGHCRVPLSTGDHASLARWVMTQCSTRRKGKLSAERVRRLDELGFVWEVQRIMWQARWESMYEALAAYRQAHGHCRVPLSTRDHSSLSQWVAIQRRASRKGKLSKERVCRLNELGFVWEMFKEQWEGMFVALVKYKTDHGNCDVPVGWLPDPKLANWVKRQRNYSGTGNLLPQHKQRLDTLGFRWSIHRTRRSSDQASSSTGPGE